MHTLIQVFGESTANQLARYAYLENLIPYPTRGIIQPRLTELEKEGIVEVVGKKYDAETKDLADIRQAREKTLRDYEVSRKNKTRRYFNRKKG